MLRYLPLIVKNSMRSKRRSLLTVASAAISLCLLGILMAIYNAFYVADAPPQQPAKKRVVAEHYPTLEKMLRRFSRQAGEARTRG